MILPTITIAGQQYPSSNFLWIGDPFDTATWYFRYCDPPSQPNLARIRAIAAQLDGNNASPPPADVPKSAYEGVRRWLRPVFTRLAPGEALPAGLVSAVGRQTALQVETALKQVQASEHVSHSEALAKVFSEDPALYDAYRRGSTVQV